MGVLTVCNIHGFDQFGAIAGWATISGGSFIALLGASIKCIKRPLIQAPNPNNDLVKPPVDPQPSNVHPSPPPSSFSQTSDLKPDELPPHSSNIGSQGVAKNDSVKHPAITQPSNVQPSPPQPPFSQKASNPKQKGISTHSSPIFSKAKAINKQSFCKHQNDHYKTSILENIADEDPIFMSLKDIDEDRFEKVANDWQALEWFKKLDRITIDRFSEFLRNIHFMAIPRQNEVFRDEKKQREAYSIFRKAVINIFDKLKANSSKGEHIVLQLNIAVGECPLTYLSSISSSLHVLVDNQKLMETLEKTFHINVHRIYSLKRKEIVEEMATRFGRKETHTVNSILHLIGKERKIPGYKFVIEDKQIDLQAKDKPILIQEFDKANSPKDLIDWFYRKINALIDDKHYLHVDICNYLAWYFDVDIQLIREIVFDENFNVKIEIVTAILEICGIIELKKSSNAVSACLQLELLLKEKIASEYELDEMSSPIGDADWSEIPLKNLLILSDKNFYYIQLDELDYTYLHEQFINTKERKTPKETLYSDEDHKKFISKVKRLNLNSSKLDQEGPEEKKTNQALEIQAPSDPFIERQSNYRSLENLILNLIKVPPNGDFEAAIIPYLEVLDQQSIKELILPDLNDMRFQEINMYNMNMHVVAIYLWNGLKAAGYQPASPPSATLTGAAQHHSIELL